VEDNYCEMLISGCEVIRFYISNFRTALSSVKVKNAWSSNSTPHISSWRGV